MYSGRETGTTQEANELDATMEKQTFNIWVQCNPSPRVNHGVNQILCHDPHDKRDVNIETKISKLPTPSESEGRQDGSSDTWADFTGHRWKTKKNKKRQCFSEKFLLLTAAVTVKTALVSRRLHACNVLNISHFHYGIHLSILSQSTGTIIITTISQTVVIKWYGKSRGFSAKAEFLVYLQ